MKSIKFMVCSENLKEFTREFKDLVFNMHHPKFASAELQYSTLNGNNPEFPLILKAKDNTFQICVKDVAIGAENNQTSAMLKALEIAGFKMRCALCNAIRNEPELHITIWND